MTETEPMSYNRRHHTYQAQHKGQLTPRQRRRLDHKTNVAVARVRRALEPAQRQVRRWRRKKG